MRQESNPGHSAPKPAPSPAGYTACHLTERRAAQGPPLKAGHAVPTSQQNPKGPQRQGVGGIRGEVTPGPGGAAQRFAPKLPLQQEQDSRPFQAHGCTANNRLAVNLRCPQAGAIRLEHLNVKPGARSLSASPAPVPCCLQGLRPDQHPSHHRGPSKRGRPGLATACLDPNGSP